MGSVAFALVYRPSEIYNQEYVNRIIRGINKYAPNYPIFVLTNEDDEFPNAYTILTIHPEWSGWWSKLELFRPDIFSRYDKIIYIDLDTIVCGSLKNLIDMEIDYISGLDDFYHKGQFASGVMLFRPQKCEFLYESMRNDWKKAVRGWICAGGDQAYISMICKKHGITPSLMQNYVDGIISYKTSKLGENSPQTGTMLVCFHGKPKPHQVSGWAKEAWIGTI